MKIIKFVLLLLCGHVASAKVTCRDDDGNPVDMFILYKLPRINWYDVPKVVADGHGYAYLDSNNLEEFRLSPHSIADQNSAAGQTLDQVYQKYSTEKEYVKINRRYINGAQDVAHVFYNDENPDGVHWYEDCGHAKGAVAFDSDSGFWMITSVPKYPNPASEKYTYPHSGCMYGQMFLCVSFNTSLFNEIGLQLRFNNPHIHDANLPTDWESHFPNIKKLLDGDIVKQKPFANVITLRSLAGTYFFSFAKTADFHKDLYRDLVAPWLKDDILTETWQHGHVMHSSCNVTCTVEDIQDLDVHLSQSFPFKNSHDHSKFVVGKSKDTPYVCVGDINRATTQFVRGGGTMCLRDESLWRLYRSFVIKFFRCA